MEGRSSMVGVIVRIPRTDLPLQNPPPVLLPTARPTAPTTATTATAAATATAREGAAGRRRREREEEEEEIFLSESDSEESPHGALSAPSNSAALCPCFAPPLTHPPAFPGPLFQRHAQRRRRRFAEPSGLRSLWTFHNGPIRIFIATLLYFILIATNFNISQQTSSVLDGVPNPPNLRTRLNEQPQIQHRKPQITFQESDFGHQITFQGLHLLKKYSLPSHTQPHKTPQTTQTTTHQHHSHPANNLKLETAVAHNKNNNKRRPIISRARTNGSALPVFQHAGHNNNHNNHKSTNHGTKILTSGLPTFLPPPDIANPPTLDQLFSSPHHHHHTKHQSWQFHLLRIIGWMCLAAVIFDRGFIEVQRRFGALLRITTEVATMRYTH